jgi:hypothetical protein
VHDAGAPRPGLATDVSTYQLFFKLVLAGFAVAVCSFRSRILIFFRRMTVLGSFSAPKEEKLLINEKFGIKSVHSD